MPNEYYDLLCYQLIDRSKDRFFRDVRDRRYLLDQYSLGTLMLKIIEPKIRLGSSTTDVSDTGGVTNLSPKLQLSTSTDASSPTPISDLSFMLSLGSGSALRIYGASP